MCVWLDYPQRLKSLFKKIYLHSEGPFEAALLKKKFKMLILAFEANSATSQIALFSDFKELWLAKAFILAVILLPEEYTSTWHWNLEGILTRILPLREIFFHGGFVKLFDAPVN